MRHQHLLLMTPPPASRAPPQRCWGGSDGAISESALPGWQLRPERLLERQDGKEGNRCRGHDHEGRAVVVGGARHQPRRDQRAEAADDAQRDVVAERDRRAANGYRRLRSIDLALEAPMTPTRSLFDQTSTRMCGGWPIAC